MADVFIATPVYTGDVCWEYCASLLHTVEDLKGSGHAVRVEFHPGCCYVALSRNILTALFMESGCTDLVFIDADLRFPTDGVRKLIESPGDIVGGLYPFKIDAGGFPVRPFSSERVRYANGLIEADGLPTGFMRIKRHVIDGMIEHFPDRRMVQTTSDGTPARDVWNLFNTEQVGTQFYGEDYRFCHLAQAAGYRTWIHPDLEFSHVGRKGWSGTYQGGPIHP